MTDVQFKRDYDGYYICPYNDGCHCTSTKCDSCGWNPTVGNARLVAIAEQLNVPAEELTRLYSQRRCGLNDGELL